MRWEKILALVLIFILLAGFWPTVGEAAEQQIREGKERYIVTFKNGANKSTLKTGNGSVRRELKHFKSASISLTKSEAVSLQSNTDIVAIEPDIQLKVASQTSDWGMTAVNATYAWDNGYTGKGVKVAVLDSGIDIHHEDVTVAGGASFVDYTTSYNDDFGHGTHVAGIIGAQNNTVGVVGVAPDAELYAVKVLDQTGVGYLSDVIAGIDWSIENGMDIINLSMTTDVDSFALRQAVDEAYAKGVLLVASAGNTGNMEGSGETIQYPAKYSSVISVGAVDPSGVRAAFSATGAELEVVAPGVGVNSSYKNNSYKSLSGTSMASSFVSGALAVFIEKYPDKATTEIRSLLHFNINNSEINTWNEKYGLGAVRLADFSEKGLLEKVAVDTVSSSVYSHVNGLLSSSATGPSVISKYYSNKQTVIADESAEWPPLQNAIAIAFGKLSKQYSVLYSDYSIKTKYNNQIFDSSSEWPPLQNAKSIVASNWYGNFVLYKDNTIKKKYKGVVTDVTSSWGSSLQNAKAIALDEEKGNFYTLYNNNTVIMNGVDTTAYWPSLENARSITLGLSSYSTPEYYKYSVGYFDQNPIITVNHSNYLVYKGVGDQTITLTGNVSDPDNDNVTITASIAGITKTATISNTSSLQQWTLQWNIANENIPAGTYTNIMVSANDILWGNDNVNYVGTIVVDTPPNKPSNLTPGSVTPGIPVITTGITPSFSWSFSDVDAGDTQSAYEVQIFNAAGTTLLYDSGWVTSGANSYTVPANVLSRGTAYSWRVAVKDNKGGVSNYSDKYYIKINSLPNVIITSYADGQQMTDNVLTFTWNYSDVDNSVQSAVHILGTKDNWTTVGYNSGPISGASTVHQTTPLSDGTWSFKILVNDGYEWSTAIFRKNLVLPNAFEPNNTASEAFPIIYDTTYSSLINSINDVDFFKYTANKTGLDRITLGVPVGLNYDAYIYDSSMNLIAASVRSTSMSENVLYEVSAGSTYYVKLVGVGGNYSTTASYSLKVSKFIMDREYHTDYQYDGNGNIKGKTTIIK